MTALKLRFLLISLACTPFLGEASLSTSDSSQCSLEGLRGRASAKGKESKNNKNDINLGGGPPGYPIKIIYPGTGRGLSKPLPKASLYKTNNPKDPVDMGYGMVRQGMDPQRY